MDNWESNDHYEFFKQFYRCYSLSRVDKVHLESGNKIFMPQSAIDRIAYTDIEYPLQFELRNLSSGKITHCGVLEFTAEEGFIYIPNWMMETMKIQEYDTVRLKNVSLIKATHMKLQPHTQDFLQLSNPKDVLETTLRNFSCITCGDTIMIMHDKKKFYIDILETKPSSAVCMIDTDCEVDFAPPLDYKEPEKPVKKAIKPSQVQEQKRQPVLEEEEKVKVVQPFSGKARRLNGMPSSVLSETPSDTSSVLKEKQLPAAQDTSRYAKPELRKVAGKLMFGSNVTESRREVAEGSLKEDSKEAETHEKLQKFQPFTGKGFSLRHKST